MKHVIAGQLLFALRYARHRELERQEEEEINETSDGKSMSATAQPGPIFMSSLQHPTFPTPTPTTNSDTHAVPTSSDWAFQVAMAANLVHNNETGSLSPMDNLMLPWAEAVLQVRDEMDNVGSMDWERKEKLMNNLSHHKLKVDFIVASKVKSCGAL